MTFWNKDIRAEDNLEFSGVKAQTRAAKEVYVRKNPVVGQFASVKAAVDSITDASSSNVYKVCVGPGEYLEDAIQMKPHVWVEGSGDATTLKPNAGAQHIVLGAVNS